MRVMWLLNHSSARKAEIPLLNSVGINEIFLPKIIPDDINFRSASVDFSQDQYLTIPSEVLVLMNTINWYRKVEPSVWDIVNKYFDVVFFIAHDLTIFEGLQYFDGLKIWRAYGLDKSTSYSRIANHYYTSVSCARLYIERFADTFFLGQAYPHLGEIEDSFIRNKVINLPLSLADTVMTNEWVGDIQKIFFVCPDIVFNPYYRNIYETFINDFHDFDYCIGGAQPIKVSDDRVLGFVSAEEHKANMVGMRVMFYHSQEKNHIHYHPFEAIRVGMPLVFMAGGLLDLLGGENLPGRCLNIRQARDKVRRILSGDWLFINEIKKSQTVLLEMMKHEHCAPVWKSSFELIKQQISVAKLNAKIPTTLSHIKKIAVIIPVSYRGGSLRAAKLIANAIVKGAELSADKVEIIFSHPEAEKLKLAGEFDSLNECVKIRQFSWEILPAERAIRAMHYAGFTDWKPDVDNYIVPNDNINYLYDCDTWVVISDRVSYPVLPIKPILMVIYDYIQRYVDIIERFADLSFIDAARRANAVIVTTDFTLNDALQYAGVEKSKLHKLPMLFPLLSASDSRETCQCHSDEKYFLWTTNASKHKNHTNAIRALDIYYRELDGKFKCYISGVNTDNMFHSSLPHMQESISSLNGNRALKKMIKVCGELSEFEYIKTLRCAAFLWHPAIIDNGTFSVVEAAGFNIQSACSLYPAMQEISDTLNLDVIWFDPFDPREMALKLKYMEGNHNKINCIDAAKSIRNYVNDESSAVAYWDVIKKWL